MAKREYRRSGLVKWIDDERYAHREGGPAAVYADGGQFWWRHGQLHFAHGPADLWPSGTLRWYEAGELLLRERYPYG